MQHFYGDIGEVGEAEARLYNITTLTPLSSDTSGCCNHPFIVSKASKLVRAGVRNTTWIANEWH